MVAELPPFLFWVLLSPTLNLDSFQDNVCSLTVFFLLDVCAILESSCCKITVFNINYLDFVASVHFLLFFRKVSHCEGKSWLIDLKDMEVL